MQPKSSNITYFLIFIALCGYILPWILTPTSPLSLNAYDLAEWSSLHPSQPHTSPTLVIPLFLRLQLVVISLLLVLNPQTIKLRWIALIFIVLLSVAQLPPLEFFINATDNINYQQQFTLATISLLVGVGLIIGQPRRGIPIIAISLLVIGIVTSISGLQQAQQLYTQSLQEYTTGVGIIFILTAYSLLLLINIFRLMKSSYQQ